MLCDGHHAPRAWPHVWKLEVSDITDRTARTGSRTTCFSATGRLVRNKHRRKAFDLRRPDGLILPPPSTTSDFWKPGRARRSVHAGASCSAVTPFLRNKVRATAAGQPETLPRQPRAEGGVTALHDLSAAELARRPTVRGDLSPVEVAQDVHRPRAALRAGAARHVRASTPETALAMARGSEPRASPAGRSRCRLLDGVPVTIKENIATKRRAAAAGHRRHRCWCRRRKTHPPAARLREAGRGVHRQDHDAGLRHAVFRPVSSFHALEGRLTRNPWDTDASTPAAAAPVPAPRRRRATGRCISAPTSAARIRLPASLVRHRRPQAQQLGRVPIKPPYAGPRAAGPMTRTVTDAAADDGRAEPARRLATTR